MESIKSKASLQSKRSFIEMDETSLEQSKKSIRRYKPSIQKSLAMCVILDFLPRKMALHMQVLSKRMYTQILPSYFRSVPMSNKAPFCLFQFEAPLGFRLLKADDDGWRQIELTATVVDKYGRVDTEVLKSYRGFKVVPVSRRAPRFYVIGGIAEKAVDRNSVAAKKGIHIDTSPCFEYYGSGGKLVKRADMTSQRQYVTAAVVSDQIYCLGGKGKFVMFKTIEKYLIAEDRWVEIRTQLNYARYFGSCCQFQDRYIYIFGGTSDTD